MTTETERRTYAAEAAAYLVNYGRGPNRGLTNQGTLWWMSARYSMQLARRLRRGDVVPGRYRFSWRNLVDRARHEVREARTADRRWHPNSLTDPRD